MVGSVRRDKGSGAYPSYSPSLDCPPLPDAVKSFTDIRQEWNAPSVGEFGLPLRAGGGPGEGWSF